MTSDETELLRDSEGRAPPVFHAYPHSDTRGPRVPSTVLLEMNLTSASGHWAWLERLHRTREGRGVGGAAEGCCRRSWLLVRARPSRWRARARYARLLQSGVPSCRGPLRGIDCLPHTSTCASGATKVWKRTSGMHHTGVIGPRCKKHP